MMATEEPTVLECAGARLVGILHKPEQPRHRAVLVVVGGPQYRVGSHRQFVLLARHVAAHGFPVLRFDYRGIGDSEEGGVSFEHTAPDIESGIDALVRALPQVHEVVIWGLCDGASAALLYAFRDPRVKGLVLLNPWVRSDRSEARAYLQHYYKAKALDLTLWKRIAKGEVNLWRSAVDVVRTAKAGLGAKVNRVDAGGSFVARMRAGFQAFAGNTLVILSGDDLTAQEFKDEVGRSSEWSKALGRRSVAVRELPAANHTFARNEWRNQVAAWTVEWIESW